MSPLSLGMHQLHSTHGKSTMYWACGSGKTPQIHTCIKPPLKKNPEDRAKRMQLNKQLVKFNIKSDSVQHCSAYYSTYSVNVLNLSAPKCSNSAQNSRCFLLSIVLKLVNKLTQFKCSNNTQQCSNSAQNSRRFCSE